MSTVVFISKGDLQFVAPYFVTISLPVQKHPFSTAASNNNVSGSKDNKTKKPTLREFFAERYKHFPPSYVDAALALGRISISATNRPGAAMVQLPPGATADSVKLELQWVVNHSVHYHEPPIVFVQGAAAASHAAAVLKIQIVDFIPVPVSAASDSTVSGVVVVNKPRSVPVHASGHFHRNTVEFMLRSGHFEVRESFRAKFQGSGTAEAFLRQLFATPPEDDDAVKKKLYPCHRLDKGTSGVFLLATNAEVAKIVMELLVDKSTNDNEEMQQQQTTESPALEKEQQKIGKTYIARVHGRVIPPADATRQQQEQQKQERDDHVDNNLAPPLSGFLLQRPIYAVADSSSEFWCVVPCGESAAAAVSTTKRDDRAVGDNDDVDTAARRPRTVPVPAAAAAALATTKWAATWIRPLPHDSQSNTSLVECKPVTGRTHQIRVHLASIGCPIVGDDLYCRRSWSSLSSSLSSTAVFSFPLTALEPGKDFQVDNICPECCKLAAMSTTETSNADADDANAQQQQRRVALVAEQFKYGCPLLALHAWKYELLGCVVEAPLPEWATQS